MPALADAVVGRGRVRARGRQAKEEWIEGEEEGSTYCLARDQFPFQVRLRERTSRTVILVDINWPAYQ